MASPSVTPVFAPDGTIRSIPGDQVKDAISAGGKLAIQMKAPSGDIRYVPHDQVAAARAAGGEIYDSQGTPQDSQPKEGFWHSLGSVFGLTPEAWQAAKQKAANMSPMQEAFASTKPPNPVDLVKNAATAIGNEFQKGSQEGKDSLDALQQGNIKEFLAHQIGQVGHAGAMLAAPVLGNNLSKAGEQVGEGNVAGAAGTVTGVVAPMVASGAYSGAAKAISKVGPDMAERMYSSALKPSTTIPMEQRANIVRTGLDNAIPISQEGATKLSGLIDDYNAKVQAHIKGGAASGATVDPKAIAARADQVKAKFANQVNPGSDMQAIDAAKQEFVDNNPNPIPVDQAQTMKAGTYQQLKGRAYGELKSATVEAQKALARGIKEELETQFPEIKSLNAQQSKFYDLDGVLEKALNRIGNHQLMGIGTPIVTGAATGIGGAMFGHGPEAGALGLGIGVMKAVLDNPVVKSRLAITLSNTGKIPPAVANARVAEFANALAQSQSAAAASAAGTGK